MQTLASLGLALALLHGASLVPGPGGGSGLERALALASAALAADDLAAARAAIDRALERDPNSLRAWELEELWAEKRDDRDARVYALHRRSDLARAQGHDKAELAALRARLAPLDPVAESLFALRASFVEKLTKLAEGYEKAKRAHSAIRALKQALALDPERDDIRASIERLAAAPDPSLAEDARPRDLLEGFSQEWIAEFDAEHSTWKDRARLEKPNYVTQTDAGYEVLVRTAEAMEQMNAFYRLFFRYGAGDDKRNPGRIEVNIFKNREGYTQDPNDWSGGHFTGSAVETYIGQGGFEAMTSTLFHEAAHQFVSLATSAAGWLNEGMASFFEGTRILANGTVIMNLPASGRLFPLIERLERGWMKDVHDGIDPADVTKEPLTAPTFRIVLEDEYDWGPPWYAPTWGVVYFLYNFQDPVDGRFVYRKAFFDYVDASGGKQGKGAVETFEEVVLGHPEPVTEGLFSSTVLPRTVDEVDPVWKDFLLALADQQTGRDKTVPPYSQWARNARKRGALDDAAELYERALRAAPRDVDVALGFAELLAEGPAADRAVKLLHGAAAELENAAPVDEKRLADVERRLRKLDPQYQRVDDVRAALVQDAQAVIERYLAAELELMAMDVAFRLGTELEAPALFAGFEQALRREGRSLARWKLAYDEASLAGWNAAGLEAVFQPEGETLAARNGTFASGANDYTYLTLDEVTSGDFSMEAEIDARFGKVTFAGLVFGAKSASDFHALVLFPPPPERNGFVNLVTFRGADSSDTWRRNPVQHRAPARAADGERSRGPDGEPTYYRLRIDVTGRLVDTWVNGEFLATQEFPRLDVLRGSFGLLTGRGETRFRNVRYLARGARDPSAEIERRLRQVETGASSVNGSWLGLVPPFPTVKEWLQAPRASWLEAQGSPQLLVLWSVAQNEAVQIDAWLRDLAAKHEHVGLRVVSVLSGWDADEAPGHLEQHAFPGSLAIDAIEGGQGLGVSFERFDVARFHLPRLLLLDIDGRVVWEGDPGFTKGERWDGQESLLDVPLRELIQKRKLPELLAWRKTWPEARAALARGEFEAALPALRAAADFDASVTAEVAEALGMLAAFEDALGALEPLGAELAQAAREPALEALLAWAEAADRPVKETKGVKSLLKAENLSAWKRAQAALKPVLGRLQAGRDAGPLAEALARVAALPGAFPAELVARAQAAAADPAQLRRVLEEAPSLPARWLASERFRW